VVLRKGDKPDSVQVFPNAFPSTTFDIKLCECGEFQVPTMVHGPCKISGTLCQSSSSSSPFHWEQMEFHSMSFFSLEVDSFTHARRGDARKVKRP
jgi:hypothetical protein